MPDCGLPLLSGGRAGREVFLLLCRIPGKEPGRALAGQHGSCSPAAPRELPARERAWGKPGPRPKTWGGCPGGQDRTSLWAPAAGLGFQAPQAPQNEQIAPKRVCAGPSNAPWLVWHPTGLSYPSALRHSKYGDNRSHPVFSCVRCGGFGVWLELLSNLSQHHPAPSTSIVQFDLYWAAAPGLLPSNRV